MKISILGTGTSVGIPMIACHCDTCRSTDSRDKRLRTSAHLEFNDIHIQIDIGPDFRQQILNSRIPKVDLILLTHEHADHTSGLDEIRAFNFAQDDARIPLYSEDRVLTDLKKRFDYIFGGNKYPGLPSILLNHIVPQESILFHGLKILPLRIQHGTLGILGYRIGNFAYITDASAIPEETMESLMGLDVLIINALRIKEHHSHFNLEQALEVISHIKAKRTFITHISHQMGLHDEIEKTLPPHVQLAYDGLIIESE